MTAPVRFVQAQTLGDLDDFVQVCGFEAWFVEEGWKAKQLAADHLQALAELWGLIEEVGQDRIQKIMAVTFARLAMGAG